MAKKLKGPTAAKRRKISEDVSSESVRLAGEILAEKNESGGKPEEGDTQTMPQASEQPVSQTTEDAKRLDQLEERLKSLTSEREGIVKQLLEIRNRAGRLLAQAGHPVDEGVPQGRRRGRPRKTAAAVAAPTKRRGRPPKTAEAGAGGKQRGRPAGSKVKCKICGTIGHNARGHAKWEAAQGKA